MAENKGREQVEKEIAAELGFSVIVESCQISGDADKTLPLTIVRRGNYLGIASESELSLWDALLAARLRLREVEAERDALGSALDRAKAPEKALLDAIGAAEHWKAQAGKLADAARALSQRTALFHVPCEYGLEGGCAMCSDLVALRSALLEWDKL